MPPKDPPHAIGENLRAKGLELHLNIKVALKAAKNAGVSDHRRRHEDRHIVPCWMLSDSLDHREAVHLRHQKICDHESGRVLGKGPKPLEAIRRGDHFKALIAQHPITGQDKADHATCVKVILDDQHLRGRHGRTIADGPKDC